jgi:hypothetical protein
VFLLEEGSPPSERPIPIYTFSIKKIVHHTLFMGRRRVQPREKRRERNFSQPTRQPKIS